MERIKVLLVDDEVDFAASLAKRLNRKGFEAVTANDGESALAALEEGGIQVVVLDVRMPDMDGVQLLKRIRQMGDSPPILMLSGDLVPEAAVSSLALGAHDYLMKPFPLERLTEKLRDACRTPADRNAPHDGP